MRSNSRSLVVLLTRQLPSRVWSIGELTVAFLNDVQFIPVVFPSFNTIEDSFVEDIKSRRALALTFTFQIIASRM